MAGNILQQLGSNNQTITITLASLANNSARESTVIDNTSNLFMDAGVMVKIKTGGSSTTSIGYANIYAYGTSDGGTTYSDTCTGSDAAVTLTAPPNLKQIGIINLVANSTTYKAGPFSVAAAFGYLPAKWGIVIENKCGGTFDSTGGNFAVFYQGVEYQYT